MIKQGLAFLALAGLAGCAAQNGTEPQATSCRSTRIAGCTR